MAKQLFLPVLTFILLSFTLSLVATQQCEQIQHTIAIDESLRTSHLDCTFDSHHEVRIFTAEYRVLRWPGAPPSHSETDNDSCFIRGLTAETINKCHNRHECLFTVEDMARYEVQSRDRYPYACDFFQGERYLMITWQCRAILNRDHHAYAIDLHDNRTHEITFAVVDSHDLWRWVLDPCHSALNHDCSIPEKTIKDLVLISKHEMGCRFIIPANTEVWVLARDFYKSPPEGHPNYPHEECDQRIQVYNYRQRWILCSEKDFFKLPCQNTEQTLYLSYVSNDNNIRVGFSIYVEVDQAAQFMSSTCGINVDELPTPPNTLDTHATTTTTTTTLAPFRSGTIRPSSTEGPTSNTQSGTQTQPTATPQPTPQPTPHSTDKADMSELFEDVPVWLIIVLALVVSFIIMLIIIIIVCCRHCCKKTGYLEDNQSLDAFAVASNISTSESWGSASQSGDPKSSPKLPPSVLANVNGTSRKSESKTVRFSDDSGDEKDEEYMVGGDAKYSSLKNEGYDFF